MGNGSLTLSPFTDQQQAEPAEKVGGGIESEQSIPFDEHKFIDKAKKSCLLCRRQFPNVETLDKHVQMSNLHKVKQTSISFIFFFRQMWQKS